MADSTIDNNNIVKNRNMNSVFTCGPFIVVNETQETVTQHESEASDAAGVCVGLKGMKLHTPCMRR